MRNLMRLLLLELSLGVKDKWVSMPVDALRKKPELADEFIRLIQASYASIGGHLEFTNASSFFNGDALVFDAIDVDEDPEADVLRISKKSPYGLKSIASATDGSPKAKAELFRRAGETLGTPGYYAEVSEAMAHILITRLHVPFVGTKEQVERVLGKKVEWVGSHPEGKYPGYEGWYERAIQGHKHLKIMVGIPRSA